MRELIRHILRERTNLIFEMPKKSTTTDFVKKSQDIHGDKYDYSKSIYINNSTPIEIICKKHGSFLQKPLDHLRGRGCKKCYEDRRGMSLKPSLEDFIKKSREIHGNDYDYSNSIYVNNRTKLKITCPKHGEFSQSPNKHLSGQGCPLCGNEKSAISNTLSQENFIERASQIHNNKYDYSDTKYIANGKIKISCPIHGVFYQRAKDHLRGVGCPKCVGRNRTTEEFIEKANQIHNNKYDYSETIYNGSKNDVKIICPEHGEFLQTPNTHLSGVGCSKCAGQNRTTQDFIKLSKDVHGEKYDYSQATYKSATEKLQIICPKHGVFSQKPSAHLSGQGCPYCNESKGESLIDKILKLNSIEFIRQHKFIDCTNQIIGKYCRKLPFDFFIPSMNTCIEYDGIQHFQPVDNFGGEESFLLVKKKDKLKDQYCDKNGIKLIRIPYTMSPEEIETFLLMELGIT